MMIAGSGVLDNVAIGLPQDLGFSLDTFADLPITSQFSDVVTQASGSLSGGVLDSLRQMGQDFASLTNAIPDAFSEALEAIAPGAVFDGGFTGLVETTAEGLLGNGDNSIFAQIFSAAEGYVDQANQFINSNLNISSLGSTFGEITGGMDNIITGGFNQLTESFQQFGQDLASLGTLIDLNDLSNLGNPSALIKQVADSGGITPALESALRQVGLNPAAAGNIVAATSSLIGDRANKLLYDELTQITGIDLQQIKNILGVVTPNIKTAADLLDPTKIFPNSFPSMTMSTPEGLRGIYATVQGAVNTNLEKFLQDPNAPAYTGDDPIVRARLGLPPAGDLFT
jgi:hypothetical protein